MRLAGIRARILSIVALTALISVAALAGAQAQSPSPKSFARSHSVVVIGPNSPVFDTVLEKDFPGVTSVNYFQQIKPLLAIVHNNTRRVVKAYVVKWTITNSDGSTSTATLAAVSEPDPGEATLAGTVTILGPAGAGLGTELVSPFFRWPRKGFSGILPGGVQAAFAVDGKYEPVVATADAATSVHASLDGVIFGDGFFVGPDTLKLYERFQAEQQAEVDEGKWMLNLLQSSPGSDQIKAQLSQQIYDGRNSTSLDSAGLYKAARGRAAANLLSDFEQLGEDYAVRVSALLAKSKGTVLRR